MRQIPLTTTDYFLSINVLFPLVITIIACLCVFCYETAIIKKYRTQHKIKTKEEALKLFNKAVLFSKILFIITSSICYIFFHYWGFLRIPTFILCFPFGFLCITLIKKFENYVFLLLFTVSLLILITDEARKIAIDSYKSMQLVCIDKKNYNNIRTFDRGFLVKDSAINKILFITNEHDMIQFDIPKRLLELQ